MKLTSLLTTLAIYILYAFSGSLLANTPLSIKSKLIEDEGKMLFYSEKASWHGTDILTKHKMVDQVGGYLSYPYLDSVRCIFISKAPKMNVIFTTTFDKSFNLNNVNISKEERPLSIDEHDLFQMRQRAIKAVENSDSIFTFYNNTRFNIIPIINGKVKRVYIVTAPTKSGSILFGNDYLLNFDNKNEITSIDKIHNSLIAIDIQQGDSKSVGGMHNHLPEFSEYISPTDICTLMLYQYITNWEFHYVMSENYVSKWDCKTNTLEIIPYEEFIKDQNTSEDE